MNGIQYLLLVAGFAGAIYFVKSIKISVSGAEAYVEDSRSIDSEDEMDSDEVSFEPIVQETEKPSQAKTLKIQPALNKNMSQMVSLLNQRRLCDFIKFTQDEGLNRNDQLSALELSIKDPMITELSVFFDEGIEKIDQYKTVGSKAFLLGQKVGAFSAAQWVRDREIEKGLTEEHQKFMAIVDQMEQMDPGNIFYTFFRNQIYMKYKNVGDTQNQLVYDNAMSKSRYENPIFERAKKLFGLAKNNVAHFYLSQKIFEQNVTIDRYFGQRLLWSFYAPDLREHLAGIYQKHVDQFSDSSKAFGYEHEFYAIYTSAIPYELYETLPPIEEYDGTLTQPTYELSDLKLDLSKGCKQSKVDELAIKLRAI